MKNKLFKITFILIGLQFSACSEEINTSSFYLRIPFMEKEMIQYTSKNNGELQFWEISRSKTAGYIKTKRFTSKNKFIDETTERVTKHGSELISYEFRGTDEVFSQKIMLYPIEKDVMKWNLKESSVYSGEYIYKGLIFQFKRKRNFLRKEKQTIIFKDSFEFKPMEGQVSNQKNEWNVINYNQTSYFEKNKGLVKYERVYSNGKEETFEQTN